MDVDTSNTITTTTDLKIEDSGSLPPTTTDPTKPTELATNGDGDPKGEGDGERPPPGDGQQPFEIAHAIQYVTTIKKRFANDISTYKQFLEILHTYQRDQQGIKYVLEKVTALFADHPDLLKEFTYFLPDAYHYQQQQLALAEAQQQQQQQQQMIQQQQQMVQQNQNQNQNQQQNQQQPVEFDHAISYVTTIKKRFANEPDTYKQFLEILHTYQKEQRGIKDVLEQVSTLFADHPDLLKEFTYFLPDAVQEQAKERLSRAAADAEQRRMRRQQAPQHHPYMQQQQFQQQHYGGNTYMQQQPRQVRQLAHTKLIDMTRPLQPNNNHHRKQQQRSIKPGGASSVYNAGVERQFFDHVKETLNTQSRNGEAWNEFLKCLDMYAQEILSRSEMLQLVEDLFGKLTDLFDEFKRILSASGSSEVLHDDTWYSVPLMEIDFSRCRKCTPSYRALPRDYPCPPCSERSDEEEKVLNNVWVSLPVGSEETYTFRHMRKNQYEEALFRTEDERFEIDMILDSTASTIRILEPIAEEIQLLSQADVLTTGSSRGAGGQRFQYKLDRQTFRPMHLNAITRIYGEHGQDILDLLFKNPAKAIPIVLARMRQKNLEFRSARNDLNKRWKEIVSSSFHKSLDSKAFYFKQNDKKNVSNRVLFNEIKDVWELKRREEYGENVSNIPLKDSSSTDRTYQNDAIIETVYVGPGGAGGGRNNKKAKKEQVKFDTSDQSEKPHSSSRTDVQLPAHPSFTPHVMVDYNDSAFAHRDAYKLLMFSIEKSQLSPSDKERMGRMWRDFLGPFFGLNTNWLYAASIAEDDKSPDDPIPPGAVVATQFGQGKIISFDRKQGKYHVKLPYGDAFLHPTSVLCSVLPIEFSTRTEKYCAEEADKKENLEVVDGSKVCVGTQALYLFVRLHNVVVERLGVAMKLSMEAEIEALRVHESLGGTKETLKVTAKDIYSTYISMLSESMLMDPGTTGSNNVGNNNVNSIAARHEDRLRLLLGNGSFELSTMDKLLGSCQKHLQTMCHDETLHNMIQIYRRHAAGGKFNPSAMLLEATHLTYEEVYCFQLGKNLAGDKFVMSIQFCETLHTELTEEVTVDGGEGGSWGAKKGGDKVDGLLNGTDVMDMVVGEDTNDDNTERKKMFTLTSKMRVAKKRKDAKRKRINII